MPFTIFSHAFRTTCSPCHFPQQFHTLPDPSALLLSSGVCALLPHLPSHSFQHVDQFSFSHLSPQVSQNQVTKRYSWQDEGEAVRWGRWTKAHLLINFAPVTLRSGARCERAFPEAQTQRVGSVAESGVIKLSLRHSLSANPSACMQAERRHWSRTLRSGSASRCSVR